MGAEPTYIGAERSLIASVLAGGNWAAIQLGDGQFGLPLHQMLWNAMGQLFNRGDSVDPVTLQNALGTQLNASELASITHAYCNPASLTEYADIVREAWLRRTLKFTAERMLAELDRQAPQQTLDTLATGVEALIRTQAGKTTVSEFDVIAEKLERVKSNKGPRSISTPIAGLRLPAGVVTTIYGDTGGFKSTFKEWLKRHMVSEGYKVYDASLEDSKEMSAAKTMASKTGISFGTIDQDEYTPEQREAILSQPLSAYNASRNTTLNYNTVGRMVDIVRVAKSIKPDVVFIDYIQAISGNREVIDDAYQQAQRAAGSAGNSYVFLSQRKQTNTTKPGANAKDSERFNPRPNSDEHMAGSAGIKNFSKLMLSLYSPATKYPVPDSEGHTRPYFEIVSQYGPELYNRLLEVKVEKGSLGGGVGKVYGLLTSPGTANFDFFDIRRFL